MKRDKDTILLFKTEPVSRRWSIYKGVEYMALYGFHAQFIADTYGITKGQVYTACRQMRITLRGYRDGKGPMARKVVSSLPRK